MMFILNFFPGPKIQGWASEVLLSSVSPRSLVRASISSAPNKSLIRIFVLTGDSIKLDPSKQPL